MFENYLYEIYTVSTDFSQSLELLYSPDYCYFFDYFIIIDIKNNLRRFRRLFIHIHFVRFSGVHEQVSFPILSTNNITIQQKYYYIIFNVYKNIFFHHLRLLISSGS